MSILSDLHTCSACLMRAYFDTDDDLELRAILRDAQNVVSRAIAHVVKRARVETERAS